MNNKGIHLIWICVQNIKESIKFYTEVVGFSLNEFHEEFGWAELKGPNGALLGLAQATANSDVKAGTNAVISITVDNMEKARQDFAQKGVKLIGDVMEVPGHVKLQTFVDKDNNTFQLVEELQARA